MGLTRRGFVVADVVQVEIFKVLIVRSLSADNLVDAAFGPLFESKAHDVELAVGLKVAVLVSFRLRHPPLIEGFVVFKFVW